MKNKNLAWQFLLLTSAFLFNSCSKPLLELSSIEQTKTNSSVLAYIKELGFKDSDIVDLGADYLVDGDILFSKSVPIPPSTDNSNARTSQWGGGSYVSNSISTVTIYIDPSAITLVNIVNDAINAWNSIPNTRLKFGSTTNPTASRHITLKTQNNQGDFWCGSAYFPVGGQPGSEIILNLLKFVDLPNDTFSPMSLEQQKRTIMHEMGHTIGLLHPHTSDYSGTDVTSFLIPNTPEMDPNSIMNSGCNENKPAMLSEYDKAAFHYLYPSVPHQMYIYGERYICSSNKYQIFGLPSGASVAWSIPPAASSKFQLTQNSPSANKLTITNTGSSGPVTTTLTALVTVGSNAPVAYTMLIENSAPIPQMYISGNRYVCNSNVFQIAGLPSGASVAWSMSSPQGTHLQLSPNVPSANKLTITKSTSYPWQVIHTLTAIVTICGNTTVTYTMEVENTSANIYTTFGQSACTYNGVAHPSLSGNITANSVTYVHSGCSVTVDLSGRNVSLGSGGTPNFWQKNGAILLFYLPVDNTNKSFVFNTVPFPGDGSCPTTPISFKVFPNNQ